MNIVRRARLNAEVLEDRVCPALTIRLLPTMLMITGNPTGDIQITGVANNKVSLTDNSKALGTYNTSTLYLNLTSHLNKKVDINLGGFTLGGNITINAGLGLHTSPANTGTGIHNGRVGGSVTFLGGSGGEFFYIGVDATGNNPAATTVGGNVTYSPRANASTVSPGNQSFNSFDTQGLGVAPVVTIGGSVTVLNADGAILGQNSKVGSDFTTTSVGEPISTTVVAGTVGRNVSVTGGNTSTTLILAGVATGFTGTIIGGSVSANLGNGTNLFAFDDGSVVGGNVSINSGAGGDFFIVDGVTNGSLNINLGDGANTFFFAATAAATVFGNMSITGGNSGNIVALGTTGIVNGSLSMIFGNGLNNATVGLLPGGKVTYRGGNLGDTLTLAAAGTYLLDATFGNGINTLDINFAGLILTGIVRGGTGSDTFNQGAGVLSPTLIISDF